MTAYLESPPTIRWWKWVVAILIILVIIGLGSMFAGGHFEIQQIHVSGTRENVQNDIQQSVWEIVNKDAILLDATNIFLVPRTKIERTLPQDFPIVRTVQVLRELPGVVKIVVQERVPVALLYSGGTYYALDEDGIVFETVPVEILPERSLPVLRDQRDRTDIAINHPVVLPEVLSMLNQVLTNLPERFNITVKYVEIPATGTQELHVATHEDWKLLLDSTRPLSDQFMVMEKVLSELISEEQRKELEYLDLRVHGKAFYQ